MSQSGSTMLATAQGLSSVQLRDDELGLDPATRRRDKSYKDLQAAALEQQKQLRRSSFEVVIPSASPEDAQIVVDVGRLHKKDTQDLRRKVLDQLLETQDQDNEAFVLKFKERLERANVELSHVQVRFVNLEVSADVRVGSRGMPTVLNAFVNTPRDWLSACGLVKESKHHLRILNGVTGVLNPKRFTLLLGPPGSGKSTLLKALAGLITNGKDDLQIKGQLTYNGEALDQFNVARTSAYISQLDIHQAELTVRETFDFAARCLGVGHKAAYALELRRREKELGITPDPEVDAFIKASAVEGKRHSISTDLMLRLLGLEICADTNIGNSLIRGVSGGQRKRVTTGEMMVGPAKTLLMDEISTGLDSSTTYLITRCIRNYCHVMEGTVLMALLQPPPEVYDLFDDVMVLSEGHVVYHGDTRQVAPFFAGLGYAIPDRKGVADFLQEVTSMRDQQQYWVPSNGAYRFTPVEEFQRAFEASDQGRAIRDKLQLPPPVPPQGLDPLVRTTYALTSLQAFKATMRRDWILMQRNYFLYIFKIWQTFFVGIVTGTLFLFVRMNHDTINDAIVYQGIIFLSITQVMFNGYAEQTLQVIALPVFYKHRASRFYSAWAYALPTSLLRVPYSVLEGVLWSVMVYWLTGMAPAASRFFIFLAYMVLMHTMAIGMFRFIGAFGRDINRVNTYGSMAMILLILLGSFVLKYSLIHPWWVWVYWISPITYAQNALSLNELTDPRWSTPVTLDGTTQSVGRWALAYTDMHTESYWLWMPALVLIGYALMFNTLLFICLAYLDPPKGSGAIFSAEALAERERNRTGDAPASLVKIASSNAISSISPPSPTRPAARDRPVAEGADGRPGDKSITVDASAPVTRLEMTDVETGRDKGKGGSRALSLPFQPMAMTFRNICYYIPMPKSMLPDDAAEAAKEKRHSMDKKPLEHSAAAGAQTAGPSTAVKAELKLLTDITGSFRPGVLTALMGVSGAGKTTLMDVLCGRKTVGRTTGEIYVDGHAQVHATFARVSGYVEQFDVHSPRTTVREALLISAQLRLLHTRDPGAIASWVDGVMDLVELTAQRDALVGVPGEFGLSGEQRKRLTIGVELVANPSVVFMDEPTSGLDARAAAVVMRAVRNTVDTGRTVVCTIHQPSIDIFDAFDELLLLKRGGRVLYQGALGSRAELLVQYFMSVPGVSAPPEGLNPATWMLEISAVAAEARLGVDLADVYDTSDLARRNVELVERLSVPVPGSVPLAFEKQFAASTWQQFHVLMLRSLASYWRNPTYNAVKIAYAAVLALILGTIYLDFGKTMNTSTDVFNIMGALFICVTFLGTSNSSGVMPITAGERVVFYRERAAGMYAVLPFAVSQCVVELPYVLAQSVIYSCINYFLIGFAVEVSKFFWYLAFTYITLIFFTYYGMMFVAIMPMLELAAISSSMFYSVWFITAGFFIPYAHMPPWWQWYYWLNPLSYMLYGIITSQLGDVQSEIMVAPNEYQSVQDFLSSTLGFQAYFVPYCFLIMIAFNVFFVGIVLYAFKYLNFNKR